MDEGEKIYECEIKVLKKHLATGAKYYDWKVVPLRAAIESNAAATDVRCKACHGRVKLLNRHGDAGSAPHAVHHSRQDSSYCEMGFYFRRAQDGRQPQLSSMLSNSRRICCEYEGQHCDQHPSSTRTSSATFSVV